LRASSSALLPPVSIFQPFENSPPAQFRSPAARRRSGIAHSVKKCQSSRGVVKSAPEYAQSDDRATCSFSFMVYTAHAVIRARSLVVRTRDIAGTAHPSVYRSRGMTRPRWVPEPLRRTGLETIERRELLGFLTPGPRTERDFVEHDVSANRSAKSQGFRLVRFASTRGRVRGRTALDRGSRKCTGMLARSLADRSEDGVFHRPTPSTCEPTSFLDEPACTVSVWGQ